MNKIDKIILCIGIFISSISIVILITWGIKSYFLGYSLFSNNIDFNYASSFGNFLTGTIGILSSVFAVILIFFTFRLQREELAETKRLLRLQSFDQTFFNLIDSIKFLTENMYFSKTSLGFNPSFDKGASPIISEKEEFLGYEFLRIFKKIFYELYNQVKAFELEKNHKMKYNDIIIYLGLGTSEILALVDVIKELNEGNKIIYLYLYCHEKFEPSLGNYFRSIYQCLILIKKLEVEGWKSEAENYSNIFQARFNSWELALIFYNSLAFKKLGELINHFQFLDNLYLEDLIDKSHSKFSEDIKKSRKTHMEEILDSLNDV